MFPAGSSEELQNLMEDREIASRAVAFVVNSTRKGFVPLCANVASLMKSKRRCGNNSLVDCMLIDIKCFDVNFSCLVT